MPNGRRVVPSLTFSGKNTDGPLKDYLERVTYTDVASGSSDTVDIELQNIDEKWTGSWYPTKGDSISGKIKFKDWDPGDKTLECGEFVLDDVTFTFGANTAKISAVSAPQSQAFKTRERTKTWEKITIQGIASEIAGRYGMSVKYDAEEIQIEKLEQSDNDSSFLMSLCSDYGLEMKIYKKKITIFDIKTIEEKGPVATLKMKDFEEGVQFQDALTGTYTGARVSYKKDDDSKEITTYVGSEPEEGKKSRTLKINTTCSSEAEAKRKGAAEVNLSNRNLVTMRGDIFPDPKIVAGTNVQLQGFGKLSGKYFIDKVTWEMGEGCTQSLEAHKVQPKV